MSNITTAATIDDLSAVSPALAHYASNTVTHNLWTRPVLSPRDRSVVTLSVLIARHQTVAMPEQIGRAMDNGVEASEISEIITHLAFYAGWGNAIAAVAAAKPIFEQRGVTAANLPPVNVDPLPLDEEGEAKRKTAVAENFGAVAPGVAQFTTNVLFRDLWLRPDLAARDRSMVTVSALVATGQTAQITYHLNRAMDNGLTKPEASEMMTQLAFYAGWPNVFSALPVVKDVLDKRN
jgi:4-carboxymuconolactone decarboxylase